MAALVPIPLAIPPGIIKTDSLLASSGRYSDGDHIRFVNAKAQKIGGNKRVTTTAMSGTPRAIHAWRDFLQNQYMASGTYTNLYAFDTGFNLTNITPVISTGSLTLGGVVTATVSAAGTGYTPGTYTGIALFPSVAHVPDVFLEDCTATVVVNGSGNVSSITITSPGHFFQVGDTLNVEVFTPIPGGSGFTGHVATIGPFVTSAGSSSVAVQQSNHGLIPGQTITYAGASAFNNVTMNGTFTVQLVTNAYNYSVVAVTTANAGGAGGGNAATFSALIQPGVEIGTLGAGWGLGAWGLGTWGNPTASTSATIGQIEPRVWSLDHFGIVLLATYQGGTLYSFDPTQAEPWPRATTSFQGTPMNAPTNFRAMFITPERFVIGLCDQMVVKVCSQNDPTTWTPATANTAFQRTLQEGTKLVSGRVLAPFLSMLWSDAAAFLFQYTGSQFVYNSSVAGKDCGLIAPGAAVTVDGTAYWMGPDNFYLYNGAVSPIPRVEEIRKFVFDQINPTVAYQCTATYVPKYHEIWFQFPGTGADNPNQYVIYHINDQCWSPGTMDFYSAPGVTAGRSCGTHFTAGDTSPMMGGTDGYIYNHDPQNDDNNDNGQPLSVSLSLAPIALSEGLQNLDVEGVLWDFFEQSGNISAVVATYNRMTDPAPMDSQTQVVPDSEAGLSDYRVGGRYLTFDLSSDDLGNYFRMGRSVAFARPSARRR